MRRTLAICLVSISISASVHAQVIEGTPGFNPTPFLEIPQGIQSTCIVEGVWAYNPACCCTANWCHPIPDETVSFSEGTYIVRLQPGDHPNISKEVTFRIQASSRDQSPDGRYHLCASQFTARCLLTPAMGF